MNSSTSSAAADTGTQATVADVARRARDAARPVGSLSDEFRNRVLLAAADALENAAPEIIAANEIDVAAAERQVANGQMAAVLLKRLRVGPKGVQEMAARVRDVARLPDPLGRHLAATELDEGLTLIRESCPLGVIGFAFESRPEVIPQVGSLTLKSGNVVILKGGSEAAHTNRVLVSVWRKCLAGFPEIPADTIQLLQTREEFHELLTRDHEVDLIVPRGSYDLIHFVMRNSRIPVLGHGEGICHVYVDRAADLSQAAGICFDAKVQYPAVCNAAETLLVHQDVAKELFDLLLPRLREAGVEMRGCARTLALLPGEDLVPATEQDWATEYTDLIVSIKIVDDLDAAIDHINHYGSRHTDAIVTSDEPTARRFLNEVDSASVLHNASTRFADGFRYGLGAEIGISNSKLHARGPVGLDGLTTYKYKLYGEGHIVADYASGRKHFTHKPLP